MWIGMNKFDHRILALLKQQQERPERDSNPNLCDVAAVLHQLSYQTNEEQVVMWVNYNPVDVEIDDDNTRTSHVFEMRIGMNEFDHLILALLKQEREKPEKF